MSHIGGSVGSRRVGASGYPATVVVGMKALLHL